MQIDAIGGFNFSIQMPARPEGYILLGLYVLMLVLALFVTRDSIRSMRGREWGIFAGLAVLAIILSNVAVWHFTAPGFQPVPDRPQDTAVPATPLFAVVPLLLSGLWLGIGPTVLLSALSGFVQASLQTGQIALSFEVLIYGLIASYLLQQNYRGTLSAWLRKPLVASLLATVLSWPAILISIYVSTPGSLLAAFNYTWPLFVAGLLPTLTQGFLSGVVAMVIAARWPHLRKRSAVQSDPVWGRTINRRLLIPFVAFTAIVMIVLLLAVSETAIQQARQQSITQMARDAASAAKDVPSFFLTGQSLIASAAGDEQLRSPDATAREGRLAAALRTGPYFSQLILLDANGQPISYAPTDQTPATTLEERMLISRTLLTGAPQKTEVFAINQQPYVSFVAPVSGPAGAARAGALLGRANLQQNPITQRLRDNLQKTLGAGVGYIVSNNQIIVHPDSGKVLQTWRLDPNQTPIQRIDSGAAYEDRFPDGTARLLFTQPGAGSDWLVAIELPSTSVLELAWQVSTPLLLVLLVTLLVAALGILVLTRSITRPVKQLSAAAENIARGNLDQPITIEGDDEVSRLGSAFEQMRLSLKDRVEDLSLLLHISQAVSASLDLGQGMPPLLSAALQASPARVARMVVLSDQNEPGKVLTSGEGPQSLTPLDRAIAKLTAVSEQPVLIDNVARARARAMLDPNLLGPGLKAIAAFPVRRQTRAIAVMWLGYAGPHVFVESEVNLLNTIAGQAAVLIENARLYEASEGGRRRLEAVLASTSDAVIVTSRDSRVLLCNPAAEDAFQLQRGAAIGRMIREVWSEPAMSRLFAADGSVETRTDEIMLSDGRTLYGSASAIVTSDGQAIGRVAVMRDITHLKELDAMKSEFVATVSHDLRAPLTYMRGYATMLPMVGTLTPKQLDYTEKVMVGIEQMTDLIDDLLDLGRIEAGVGVVRENCSLAEIAGGVVESLQPQALSRGLTLKTGPLSSRIVPGDPGLLRHALTNLVDNAIKYTPSNGAITVAVEERENAMVLSVKDTGIGIAPVDQVRLFERFYRVKRRETMDIKGTGLGLAIVKSIAEWHRGRVWVESQLGEGAVFYILIPMSYGQLVG